MTDHGEPRYDVRRLRRARIATLLAWMLLIAVACGQAMAGPKPASNDQEAAPVDRAISSLLDSFDLETRPKTATLPWLYSLKEARRKGLAEGKPILVFVRSTSCLWCERLAIEMAEPDARSALANWILVQIDADESPGDAGALGVVAVPALRTLSAAGLPVGNRDGYLPAVELAKWLTEQWEAAQARPDALLLHNDVPTLVEAVKIVRLFKDRRPEIREAAIRRLMPHPQIAGLAVVTALEHGNLAEQLAAIEVLEHWKAPVEEFDPWRPETISKQQLDTLKQWLATNTASSQEPDAELAESKRNEVAASLDRLTRITAIEARAEIERLARYGPTLLPLVLERFSKAEDDVAVARLRTLRYRLLAADDLVLTWPGGIERLASTDADERHRAVGELVARCGPDDNDLLVELFSDPDPLIREISLQALAGLDVEAAHESLVRLLSDPEPNVRAAVLKELAEQPVSPMLATAVARYVRDEKDPDLVVHAIRVLRKAKTVTMVNVLIELLKHPAWQVRAEATEALGEDISSWPRQETQATVYTALLGRLSDSDNFVVSRAVEGLDGIDMEVAVAPLLEAARQHPDLVEKIIKILLSGETMRANVIAHLAEFVENDDPRVCAASIRALASVAPNAMSDEVTDALDHPSREVRVAAARVVVSSHKRLRNEVQRSMNADNSYPRPSSLSWNGSIDLGWLQLSINTDSELPPPTELQPIEPSEAAATTPDTPAEPVTPEAADAWEGKWSVWLEKHFAEQSKSPEVARRRKLLQAMLASNDHEEKALAATALICMGQTDGMVGVLVESIAAEHSLIELATEAMAWMVWPVRRDFFGRLRSKMTAEDELANLWSGIAQGPDSRSADFLWQQLAESSLSDKEVFAVCRALQESYGSGKTPPRLPAAATARINDGSPQEVLAAILLLAGAARDQAAVEAAKILDREDLPVTLRDDAFQVLLATAPEDEAVRKAVAAIGSESKRRKELAVGYLAVGSEAVQMLRDAWWLNVGGNVWSSWESGKPIVPLPPKGLKPEHVRPLLGNSDPEIVAAAGYLLAVMGEQEGLSALLAFWNSQPQPITKMDRLVYRAIAALNDSSRIAELRQIYGRLETYDVPEFYWTIRVMTGEDILKFRKEIREQVGISALR